MVINIKTIREYVYNQKKDELKTVFRCWIRSFLPCINSFIIFSLGKDNSCGLSEKDRIPLYPYASLKGCDIKMGVPTVYERGTDADIDKSLWSVLYMGKSKI